MGSAQPASVQTIKVGDVSVTFVPDGEVHAVTTAFFPTSHAEAWEEHDRWLDTDGRVTFTVGAFLVRSGDRTVLVDCGVGAVELDIPDFVRAKGGRLLDNLRSVDVAPEEIDIVVYSHLHSDHCGWTSGAGGLIFANAEHITGPSAEIEHWRANPDAAFAPPADSVLDPLENRVSFASDGQTVAPGVTLRATPGHTPGHQSVVISSGAERAILLGDVVHCPAQLLEPEWNILFDVDAALATRTRNVLLDELEGTDTAVGCCHLPESAFGRVVRGEGKRYWQVGL